MDIFKIIFEFFVPPSAYERRKRYVQKHGLPERGKAYITKSGAILFLHSKYIPNAKAYERVVLNTPRAESNRKIRQK